MITVRRSDERGHANHGWLDTYYTFSFSDYYDPEFMGFRDLRVINEDRIETGQGFPKHGHRDMEIITYVRQGAITHRDHLGNDGRTETGDVQVMSAGSGIQHEEHNLEDGLKAAFVDIGFEKNAFLHYWDIVPSNFDSGYEVVERLPQRTGDRRDKPKITQKDIPRVYPPGSERERHFHRRRRSRGYDRDL